MNDIRSPLAVVAENAAKVNRLFNALPNVVAAIRDYHLALDKRMHGDVAANEAIQKIERALGMEWVAGAELARRKQ